MLRITSSVSRLRTRGLRNKFVLPIVGANQSLRLFHTRPRNAFVDRVIIVVKAGNGGSGCTSFARGPNREIAPPDGGHGGNGGSIWIEASTRCPSLRMASLKLNAESGSPGHGANKRGRHGHDLVIPVPPGTVVKELPRFQNELFLESPEKDDEEGFLITELNDDGQRAEVARGGAGGRGNSSFKSSQNRSPMTFEPGESGETRRLELELKSIADIGLVGFPNAGKSSFLRAISHAKPRVASYPFTTLRPHIGVVQAKSAGGEDEYRAITVADIPGLIEGAHENRGLGHEFLRHIERTKFLAYVLDLSQTDGVLKDLEVLQTELELHQEGLTQRPSCVVANKMDLGPIAHGNLNALIHAIGNKMSIFPISAKHHTGIETIVEHFSTAVH